MPRRLVASVLLGTLLNPLNSSLIAVALVPIHDDFHVSLAHATWLVSGFYLMGAVGQPLMGRVVDQVGPKRVFILGTALGGIASGLAPLSPSFGWLIAARVVQALGTSAAFPAGLAFFRAHTPGERAPASALAALSIAASVSAALGPTIGGFLLTASGWQAVFLVNLPVAALAVGLAVVWLPAVPPPAPSGSIWERLDPAGVVLFAATLVLLLAFLLSAGTAAPAWPLLLATPLAAVGLVWWELRARRPFFDLRLLARGFGPGTAGLLVLPIAGLGVVATPVAARLIARSGPRPALIFGSALMLAGTLLLLWLGPGSPPLAIVLVGLVLGIPNGFNNLGLQAALYEASPPERTGWAGGQFQTFRYVGAILSSSLLAIFFGAGATTAGLHQVAVVIALISAGLVVASVASRRRFQSVTVR